MEIMGIPDFVIDNFICQWIGAIPIGADTLLWLCQLFQAKTQSVLTTAACR